MFHPRANVARLYSQRCERGRGLMSAIDCVLSECNGPLDYLEKSKEPMLKEVVKEDFIMEKEGKKEYDRKAKKRNEANWKEKSLHGKFPKSIVDFADSVFWQRLRSGYVKRNTEVIITAAQKQALRKIWIKANIDGVDCSSL